MPDDVALDRDLIRRFIARRVRDAHAADDLTQDVMLRALAHAAPPAERRRAWLLRIARNAVIDHYRAGRDDVRPIADVATPPAEDDSPAAPLARCLPGVLRHLPTPYREAVRAADLDGVAQHAIAARAGLSISAAKSRVQRGRAMLRTLMHDCCTIELDARGNVLDVAPTERTARYCDSPSS